MYIPCKHMYIVQYGREDVLLQNFPNGSFWEEVKEAFSSTTTRNIISHKSIVKKLKKMGSLLNYLDFFAEINCIFL